MRTEALKAVVIAAVAVITSAVVAVSGIIGWVGLVIPHVARMLVGPDHRKLLPASFALGASYLLVIDDISRTIRESEVPVGILTALIGAPFFAVLLRRTTPLIMTTHAPDQPLLLGSDVALLRDGRFIAHGPPRHVLTSENLRRTYDMDIEVVTAMVPGVPAPMTIVVPLLGAGET